MDSFDGSGGLDDFLFGSPNDVTAPSDNSGSGETQGPGGGGGGGDTSTGTGPVFAPGTMVDNGNGTFTDPSTGLIYNADGTSTGQTDPGYDNQDPSSSTSGLSSALSQMGLSPAMIAALAPLLGGLYAANRTHAATNQVVQGINNANSQITGLLGPTSQGGGVYAPYTQLGSQAAANLPGLGFKGINIPAIQGGALPGMMQTQKASPINFSELAGKPMLTLGNMAKK